MISSRLLVGGFSAEDEWGGTNRIQLSPWRSSVESTSDITAGMSELLGLLGDSRDRVGVLARPDDALFEGYRRLGSDVQWTLCPVYADGGTAVKHAGSRIQPFAVTARLAAYFTSVGEPWPFPQLETIARVNSKHWSHEVRRAFMRVEAAWASTASQVDSAARTLLSQGPIVIKEDFGVSGKGNCVVREPSQLRSLVRLIEQQERQGRSGGFVVEPLMDKLTDFSGHFTVHEDGRTSFDGFRQMLNVGHRYVASFALPDHIQRRLQAGSYFREVDVVLSALVKERHFGPVCIDGLMLCDGSVISTLEVNARLSMGRLSLALDKKVTQHGLQSLLFTMRVRAGLRQPGSTDAHADSVLAASGDRSFAKVLAELDQRRVLYEQGASGRFLLLGGSTTSQRWYGGYFFDADADPARDFAELLAAVRDCDVTVDDSFPTQALCAHVTQLQSSMQHEQPTACLA
jgi:hypothetical protein